MSGRAVKARGISEASRRGPRTNMGARSSQGNKPLAFSIARRSGYRAASLKRSLPDDQVGVDHAATPVMSLSAVACSGLM